MKSRISNFEIRISQCHFQMGFTLIEVTLAIGLLALMSLILYGAFYLGHRAVEKGRLRAEEAHRLRFSSQLLAGYIRSAYPYRVSLRDPIYFIGEEDRLTFVSALSLGMGGRGMSRVSIFSDLESGVLTLEEEVPVRADEDGSGHKNRAIVGQGVRSFRLDYLDPQSSGENWVNRWDANERKILPRAVRLHFKDDREEEQEWVFPIMMSVLAP